MAQEGKRVLVIIVFSWTIAWEKERESGREGEWVSEKSFRGKVRDGTSAECEGQRERERE